MSLVYTNRKGKIFYLHRGTTKTGKPKYFFSMIREGTLVDFVPDGYEIYENPNAQVFLRRIQPKIITDEEFAVVENGMKEFSPVPYYKIDVKKNVIIVYTADQDVDSLSELLKFAPTEKSIRTEELLAHSITYSPILQFMLIDETKRFFITRRYCFLGSIDDWIEIGNPDTLEKLVKKYVKHLGQDSYYELI